MAEAGTRFEDLAAVAVTQGPGLVGSLLVGLQAAKAIAYVHGKPLVPVHHVAGHVAAAFLAHGDIPLPAIALVVSGGHTSLYAVPEEGVHQLLGRTRDDAAGEAFDKVAKLLGLGYPGGPAIDRLAREANDRAVEFKVARIKDGRSDFSFSGHQDGGAAARPARRHPARGRPGRRAGAGARPRGLLPARGRGRARARAREGGSRPTARAA